MASDPQGAVDPGELVARYLGHLAGERGLAHNSVLAYGRDLRRYHEYLTARGLTSLADVDEATLGEFAAALRGGDGEHPPLAAASVARMLVAVRSLHRFAQREGALVEDVSQPVRPPAPPRRLPKALTVDQVLAVLVAAGGAAPDAERAGSDAERAAPDAEPATPRAERAAAQPAERVEPAEATDEPDAESLAERAEAVRRLRSAALLELLYGTGARISEAVGLDLDDLDLDQVTASVRLRGGSGRDRVVPLGRCAVAALSLYLSRGRPVLESPGSGTAVFLSRRGGRLSRQSAWSALRAAAEAAGIEGVSPHVLRHSFALHLLDGGADVRVVQELLGHASVRTTQIYTLVPADQLREVYAAAHPRELEPAGNLSTGRAPDAARPALPPQPGPDRLGTGQLV
ncbi:MULTISPECIES: tyrosine-type recombinase/integrase [unclassified Frankia]|uniref:tyrosine-type recombinase/integrase n=1 Tax=unclassified Frankia TaxID=2632575 RepID=UPI0027DDDA56|nr:MULTISPECIES: tyrosine-type recombinase/integrase [unclassified Frankia]